MIVVSNIFVQQPKASVYVLTYNQEKYVAQTIDSIICQKTSFLYEIIIADDHSTDLTREICLKYQKKYPQKIKLLLHEKNHGLIENYKSVLKHCCGVYIAGCAGDDYWCDENKLQKHIDYMDCHDGVVVTYHDVKTVDIEGNILLDSYLTSDCKVDLSRNSLKKCAWILPQTMCFRANVKDIFLRALNNNVKNEDTFITSIMGNFGTGAYLSEIVSSAYRQTPNGIWSMQNPAHKNLMKISTFIELQKFYKKRNDIDMINHLKKRIAVLFADVQIKQLISQDKKWYLSLLVRNIRTVGLKNFYHYIKLLLF